MPNSINGAFVFTPTPIVLANVKLNNLEMQLPLICIKHLQQYTKQNWNLKGSTTDGQYFTFTCTIKMKISEWLKGANQ